MLGIVVVGNGVVGSKRRASGQSPVAKFRTIYNNRGQIIKNAGEVQVPAFFVLDETFHQRSSLSACFQ